MTASSTPPLHVLRGILRHVKSTPSHQSSPAKAVGATSPSASITGKSSGQDMSEVTLREHVMAQYRASKAVPPNRSVMLRKLAYDYFILKTDLAERARLHELDGGSEVKLSPMEMSRRAAAKAGLQLPNLNPDLSN
uniref:Uncharacterized protein n=1 Tax=Helicotheca tamesis TaxID=374047 RepID=A0A7S2MMR4_9STRA|mmetsp:Transcript_18593/g.25594  ORF Transcript_18593/g.25594 Transcript_18593/m.25594 type:complete len:136 (+) Transcript_18593:142-549(+)|eukprot:CAMPEP_0185723868 /NCGR_PEP_ID=MMETSP1171-20130828/562_1 /TAXON_ID=374046 /ORGANISM="Helicotheca tamensis, Strain CCMP826" /LENGTH=135 /DNA_ID=CAMNT_0028391631 /DNA_START=95 /DNA_END=502 /DNA_ORIENTATION=+